MRRCGRSIALARTSMVRSTRGAVIATFVIVKVVDLVLGLRVPAHEEELGLDLAVHGEVAYQS